MSIKIGDKNKISKSEIGHKYVSAKGDDSNKVKGFINRHPFIVSFLISLLVGFILLFPFWGHVVTWIENLFK